MKNSVSSRLLLLIGIIFLLKSTSSFSQVEFYNSVKKYADQLPLEFSQISEDRKETLREIGNYVLAQRNTGKKINLLFICTHNSRRSQIGEVWGMTAAEYYGLDSILFFSGGTEATAFNIHAIEALKRAGFAIQKGGGTKTNPTYYVSNKKESISWIMYSKKYDDRQNPKKDFAAIMVCSEADKSCPNIPGADERISLPYDDPKYFDNSPSKKIKYDETVRLIGREMFYLFDYVKKQSIQTIESKK